MRTILFAGLLLVAAGCGGSGNAITDPADLPPLTAEHAAEIQKQDRQVEDEERGEPTVPSRKAGRTKVGG